MVKTQTCRFPWVVAMLTGLSTALMPSIATSQQDTVAVLVDDFAPQPLQGHSMWYYNRIGGDRGVVAEIPTSGSVVWDTGFVRVTIEDANTYIGVWTSLNHPNTEKIPLNFSGIFPCPILSQYQGRVIGLGIHVLDGQGMFCVELQDSIYPWPWDTTTYLSPGVDTTLEFTLPLLGNILNLNWFVQGDSGDFVVVDKVELDVELPHLPTPERAFLCSYAMLLANWNSASGLTRDRASFPAGDFDNVSASGVQAAAAVMAWRLEFIDSSAAVEIVDRTTTGILRLPRTCHGLLPHFVKDDTTIAAGTEWSSLDATIAIVALIEARVALGLSPDTTAMVESLLTGIDWNDLVLPGGSISHGYVYDCSQHIGYSWTDFGTESWLANFGYAAATCSVAVMDSTPPTFNGSGFIDELAWLLLPRPPCPDNWGIDWAAYCEQAAARQLDYYGTDTCYGGPPRLYGLSAAEVPDPYDSLPTYQAFGVGGDTPPNDSAWYRLDNSWHEVVVPHYAGLSASMFPSSASAFWEWVEGEILFTPLNNVESFMIVNPVTCDSVVWNALKGSWNLGLQTLGWGRLLLGDENPLYDAMWTNDFLKEGYLIMTDSCYVPFVDEIDYETRTSFALYQNCPNPFSRKTSIRFVVPDAAELGLRIFDVAGREIEKLIDRKLSPGQYCVNWQPRGLASGIYLCHLEVHSEPSRGAGGFVATRKLVLLR